MSARRQEAIEALALMLAKANGRRNEAGAVVYDVPAMVDAVVRASAPTSPTVLRRAAMRIRDDVEFTLAHGDPTFLLAVADWLEAKAEQDDKGICDAPEVCNLCEHDYGHIAALAVARAYLGEPS